MHADIKTRKLTRFALGLGSNQGHLYTNLRLAREAIMDLEGQMTFSLPVFCTDPEGGVANQLFLNQIVIIESSLAPLALLEELQRIEVRLGRKRRVKWENRVIDIDILIAWQAGVEIVVDQEQLKIPHPHNDSRWFLHQPLRKFSQFAHSF